MSSLINSCLERPKIFVLFIASTRTSTIPGISIAGPSPEATLYTPALDAEVVVAGAPLSGPVPVSPEGVPSPAIVSRAMLEALGLPVVVVDAGSYAEPRVPHIDLPSRTVGERIDTGRAMERGTASRLFSESRLLGRSLAREACAVVGESMPGGTTTAMGVMEALGYGARGRVSSASPRNPHELKARVVEEGLRASGISVPARDPFEAVDSVGDPLHVSIAGFVAGALESGSQVILAGGTQMCAVLAILARLGVDASGKLGVATTRWIIEDGSSDMRGLVEEIYPGAELAWARASFAGSRFRGLRMYEEGYVKEGVGMGGLMLLAERLGLTNKDILNAVEDTYEKIIS